MGPLNGYTVIELAGVGPAPMGGMILADMGAEVIRIDRASGAGQLAMKDVSARGKKSVALDLKDPAAIETLLRMVENADVLIDPFRPGVCEKLGIGPDICLKRNPKLVFARMTGWGQDGPLAHAAGHDINYISITGALYAMGRKGGSRCRRSTWWVIWAVAACSWSRVCWRRCWRRPVRQRPGDRCRHGGWRRPVDVDVPRFPAGQWDAAQREANMLDGGAHYYDTYECADGQYMHRLDRAAVLVLLKHTRPVRGRVRRPEQCRQVAADEGEADSGFPAENPGPVV